MLFRYSRSYDVVTLESAEDGDITESGWCFCDVEEPFREIVQSIDMLGVEHIETTYNGFRITHYSDTDMYDGSVTTKTTHVECSPRNAKRFVTFLSRR